MSDLPDIRPCFDGEQWTDATLGAWLAGLFDRAGRIDLSKNRPVTLSVQDWQIATLALIQQRLKAGEVLTVKRPRGGVRYVWRITEPTQVWRVLMVMWAYLTTSREAAYQAIDRIQELEKRSADDLRRDAEIAARRIAGESATTIAAALRITTAEVAESTARYKKGPRMPDAPLERHRIVP